MAMTEQGLIEALTMAGEYINSQLPDNPKHYEVMDEITNTLISAGAPIPWIAWGGELEEIKEDECTCDKGDDYCPVHNADYAKYIRS